MKSYQEVGIERIDAVANEMELAVHCLRLYCKGNQGLVDLAVVRYVLEHVCDKMDAAMGFLSDVPSAPGWKEGA